MALVNGELGPKEVVYPEEVVVGREFCLQYYTILTKQTDNVHRFYDEDSQMTRGSSEITLSRNGAESDPIFPSVGQKEIHKRMMAESLVNAKVKVLQFDVQKVGDSKLLVIQVCGELTNDDGPMRRFMETFVLKRTDAKKCYVVNNIFRFQDQVFCSGLEDSGTDGFNTSMGDTIASEVMKEVSLNEELSQPHVNNDEREIEPVDKADSVHVNAVTEEADSTNRYEIVEPPPGLEVKKEDVDTRSEDRHSEVDLEDVTDLPSEGVAAINDTVATTETNRTSAPGTRSWANLVSQGIGGPPKPVVMAPIMRSPKTSAPPPQAPAPTEITHEPNNTVNASDGKGQKTRDSVPNNNLESTTNGPASLEKTKYPDNVQVFVGNIPIAMKNEVLKEFFNTYGEVVDVRINISKSNGRLPNFGFVVFKAPETVQHVLTKKPIYIEGHRLNVEEKKPNGNRGARPSVGGVGSAPRSNGFGPRGPRRV